MAKANKQTSDVDQPGDQTLSERERLAMAVFTNLASTNLTTSKTIEHVVAMSFDIAAAFFGELEARRSPNTPTAVESASAAAPSQGAANGQ